MGVKRKNQQNQQANQGNQSGDLGSTLSGANHQFQQDQMAGKVRVPMSPFGPRNILADLGTTSEASKALREKLELLFEAYQKTGYTADFRIVEVSNQIYDVMYSSIVVVMVANDMAIAHTLMLEGTGSNLEPYMDNWNNTPFQIRQTAGQMYNDQYVAAVKDMVAKTTGVSPNKVNSAEVTLIPANYEYKNDTICSETAANAMNAVIAEALIRVDNFYGHSINEMKVSSDASFFVDILFDNPNEQGTDQTGMPYRKDIAIIVSSRPNHNRQNGNYGQSVQRTQHGRELIKTYGYLDFEHQNAEIVNGFETTQRFAVNFIRTHTDYGVSNMMTHLLLIALLSSISLSEDMTWVQAYTKRNIMKPGEININDIGLLNYEGMVGELVGGWGQPIATDAPDFDNFALQRYITAIVKPVMLHSVDIPMVSPDTWFLSVLEHLANGNNDANTRIKRAATALLGTGFKDNGIPMFSPNINWVHGGYYIEGTEVKDIRNLSSYLAVVAHIIKNNQSMETIRKYNFTMNAQNVPLHIRLAMREEILSSFIAGRLMVNQYMRRRTFNGGYLVNLLNQAAANGFSLTNTSTFHNTNAYMNRGFNFDNYGVAPNVRISGSAMGSAHNPYGNYSVNQNYQ